eukprot:scaffold1307_cov200-Pinguiococcus_pyrenoidosus.AAC.103
MRRHLLHQIAAGFRTGPRSFRLMLAFAEALHEAAPHACSPRRLGLLRSGSPTAPGLPRGLGFVF